MGAGLLLRLDPGMTGALRIVLKVIYFMVQEVTDVSTPTRLPQSQTVLVKEQGR